MANQRRRLIAKDAHGNERVAIISNLRNRCNACRQYHPTNRLENTGIHPLDVLRGELFHFQVCRDLAFAFAID